MKLGEGERFTLLKISSWQENRTVDVFYSHLKLASKINSCWPIVRRLQISGAPCRRQRWLWCMLDGDRLDASLARITCLAVDQRIFVALATSLGHYEHCPATARFYLKLQLRLRLIRHWHARRLFQTHQGGKCCTNFIWDLSIHQTSAARSYHGISGATMVLLLCRLCP